VELLSCEGSWKSWREGREGVLLLLWLWLRRWLKLLSNGRREAKESELGEGREETTEEDLLEESRLGSQRRRSS